MSVREGSLLRNRVRIGFYVVAIYSFLGAVSNNVWAAGKFLETIETGTAAGAVLGVSTLPFYDQPGSHLENVAFGAAGGLLASVAWWFIAGKEPGNQIYSEYRPPLLRTAGIPVSADALRVSLVSLNFP